MKRAKIPFAVFLTLGFLIGSYFIGYHFGRRDDDRMHLHMNLLKDIYLYHEADSNGLAAVKSSLGFFTAADYDFYERHYGDEKWSPAHLKAAWQIAAFAATNGDVVYYTNAAEFVQELLSTNRISNTAMEATSPR